MCPLPAILSRSRYKSIPPAGYLGPDNGIMSKLKQIQTDLKDNVARLFAQWGRDQLRKGEKKTGINAFAKYLGVGNSVLESIDSGHGNPSVETLLKIADKFGLDVWHLLIADLDPAHKPRILTSRELAWYVKVEALRGDLPELPEGSETGKFAPLPAPKRAAHKIRRKRPKN